MPKVQVSTILKAQPEDKVEVLNYRCRPPRWESGTVIWWPSTSWLPNTGPSNTYHVALDRTTLSGNPIHLTVGDEDIRLQDVSQKPAAPEDL